MFEAGSVQLGKRTAERLGEILQAFN